MKRFALLSLVLNMLRGDRRRASRYSVLLAGELLAPAGACKIIIHDLSLTGALVRGEAVPPVGTHVTLTRGEFAIDACIIWKGDNRAGLRFFHRLPVDRLFAIVHESNGGHRAAAPAAAAA
jgi:hypothetical protein